MSHRGLLIIFVGICSVLLCFAKQNFEVAIERVEISDVDSQIVKVVARVNKYNRTCKAYSLNYTLLKDMGYDLDVEIQGFALYSNEYRRTPIHFKRNACDLLKHEYLWVKSQTEKHGHTPTQCPIRAGDYYLKDFTLNGADFPAVANFPWKDCMVCLRYLHKNRLFATLKLYVTFDHDVELRRLG